MLAREIIRRKFKHPSVTGTFLPDDSFVPRLRQETAALLQQYMQLTGMCARKYFDHCKKQVNWSEEQWYRAFDIRYQVSPGGMRMVTPVPGLYQPGIKRMAACRKRARSLVTKGYPAFKKQEEKKAADQYTDCLVQLSDRLVKKGMSPDTTSLKFERGQSDAGLEMKITCQHITLRLWAVWTEETVQRPHCRLLIR